MGPMSRRFLLGMSFAGALAHALPAWSQQGVSAPAGTFILTRKVERDLADGAVIVVTRRWKVRFDSTAGGIAVLGTQLDAQVAAPESLAALAKVEEARATDELFPILLDRSGAIVSLGNAPSTGAIDSAVAAAGVMLDRALADAAAARDAKQGVALLGRAGQGVVASLPPDLFFPRQGETSDTHDVSLADGSMGQLHIDITTRTSASGPWLEQFERKVTTKVGQSERLSREIWQMLPT